MERRDREARVNKFLEDLRFDEENRMREKVIYNSFKPEGTVSVRINQKLNGIPTQEDLGEIFGRYPTARSTYLAIEESPNVSSETIVNRVIEKFIRKSVLRIVEELDFDPQLPAIAQLKRNPEFAYDSFDEGHQLNDNEVKNAIRSFYGTELLRAFVADKGYPTEALAFLSDDIFSWDDLFTNLLFRMDNMFLASGVETILHREDFFRGQISHYPHAYRGTPEENKAIDQSIQSSVEKSDLRRDRSGDGATRLFNLLTANRVIEGYKIAQTPIIVLGGGPAGLLTVRGLMDLGYSSDSITVIDKTGEYRGIWNQKNVAGLSKNNPFAFEFDRVTLDTAPGSGQTVTDFLRTIEESNIYIDEALPEPIKGTVTRVIPGDLQHTVQYTDGKIERTMTAPIVVNAIGTGKPLNPSREGYMTTDAKTQDAGIRWQQKISPEMAEKLQGKMLVFIGLGNSTGEMLVQLKRLKAQGYDINYRVLTHYPEESMHFPDQRILERGKEYTLFRDIRTPNLIKLAGDLTDIQDAFSEAVRKGRILTSVTEWNVDKEKKEITLKDRDGVTTSFHYDQLYTLIGYGHDPEELRAMGMTVTDEYTGAIAYDYDGEIQRRPGVTGRDRVYPGYFANGAVLKTPLNPNALVIPGIMHRMYDQLLGITLRSAEYHVRKNKQR